MKIQQTYPFILILQIIISLSSIIAIVWSLILNANAVPFVLLLVLSIFIFVSVYISNNRINIIDINKSNCVLSIFIVWLLLIIMGTIPFYILFPNESIKDIIFLTTSLVTTNGIWTNIEILNTPSFLIWQSILQWLGGLCTIIVGTFFVEIVLSKKSISKDYFSLENVRIIFLLYFIMTIIFIFIFKILIKDFNEAVQISMALISTSNGFTSSGDIKIEFNNITKIFMIFTMIIGSLSINLHYKSFSHGFLIYFKNKNLKIIFIFMFIFTLFLSMYSFNQINMPFIDKFVNISFLITSFITTTGLIPANLYSYGLLSNIILLIALLTLIGGAVSSTTGGLKATRIIYIYKYIYIELFRLINPRKIMAKEKISNVDEISQIFLFCILYLLSIPLLSALLSIFDLKLEDSFIIVTSAITNSGIGLMEIANINYYPNTILEVVILSIILLFGRIEIFLTMILISSLFWKKI
ncbi:MAG: Trk system potassium uptake protein TrkH [Alphaproteobacteria bacterium MarineAlpha9_Bin3]|nr:MAG: Trk system potassium uptake protein TrkH [Alphaproteobacteria bacterium MarineAlpha9_Bin3]